MTQYELRKSFREDLHNKRCIDNDQSKERYRADAKKLDEIMSLFGLTPKHKTTWGMDIEDYYKG